MNLPYIDRIWRIEGEIPLGQSLSADTVFERLDPLFQTPGTEVAREGETLSYRKRNPGAQDKLATFTRGNLQVSDRDSGETVLRFHLSSTALLLSFLAPLLFIAFGQLAELANSWEKAAIEAAPEKDKEKDKDKDKLKPVPKLNPIDEMLGAPAPEDPNKKKDKDKDKEKDEGPHSPMPAYVLAGLFLAIYLVGRVLEPWLIRRTFRKAIVESDSAISPVPDAAVSTEG
jgi:hypothetical protein